MAGLVSRLPSVSMLQSQTVSQQPDEDLGQALSPSHILEIAKRRALYFLIPFVLIAAVGSLLAAVWPAKYLSAGRILVLSPEIPSDLVRPTVVSRASERVEVLEQRILTRDNLLGLATKFHLSTSWRGLLSGTEIVDFIRQRTRIQPLAVGVRGSRTDQAIAYTVGFEYEQPRVAMAVANELLTMMLKEDARTRTSHASETTNFIERDVQRLEAQLTLLDSQIAELKQKQQQQQQQQQESSGYTDTGKLSDAKELAILRAQLLIKSATYSDSHPDIKALKRKIETLEKSQFSTAAANDAATDTANAATADPETKTATGATTTTPAAEASKSTRAENIATRENASGLGLDTLETKRAGLRKQFEAATQKLAAARLGESLERGQHSERLEVIEQPTLPQKPISPNRPKLFAAVIALALMAGGALAMAAEIFDHSVHRSSDLFSIVDSHLVVSIPYISTRREERRKKRRIIVLVAGILIAIAVAGIAIVFILPPIDLLFDKLIAKAVTIIFR